MHIFVILLFSFFLAFPTTLLADEQNWEEFQAEVDANERAATENHLNLLEGMAREPHGEFFQFVRPHLSSWDYAKLVEFMRKLQREALEEIRKARAALYDLPECREFVDAAEKKVDERLSKEREYVEVIEKRERELLERLKKKLQTEI